MTDIYSPNELHRARPRKRWAWIVVVAIAGIVTAWLIMGTHVAFTVVHNLTGAIAGGNDTSAHETPQPGVTPIAKDPEYAMPEKDSQRLDILVLGMRGREDVQDGGTLSDSILLFSLDTKNGHAALTSIPRDLTVRVTDTKTEKINTAYIYNGLDGTKKLYSRVTGVNIDHIIVFDFTAFKYIVDTLGGVTITLDKPFEETEQWGYSFSLPAGKNTLNGDQALYYARSRYGSSDFDRSRRQMQIIMAIKEKVAALDLTSNPIKALELVTTVRKHIETDMNIFDLGTLKQLATEGDELNSLKRYQLTTENFLYETKVNGIYELLPRGGTLQYMKKFFQSIFSDHPTMDIPTPTPTP